MAGNGKWGWRAIASLIVFIIATLLTPIAIVGHWGHSTVIDAEQYMATVGPLIEQEPVQRAVAEAVTDAVVTQIDTTQFVDNALTGIIGDNPISAALTAPLAAGVNNMIGELAFQLVKSDAFKTVWVETNRMAQASLVKLLEGNPEGIVQTRGDEIVIDISTLLANVQQQIVDRGFTAAANITIPETDRVIVLTEVKGLSQLQFIYRLSSPIMQWFPLLVMALFGLAISLARNRTRTITWTGVSLLAMAGVTMYGLDFGQESFSNALQGTVFEQAATAFWTTFFSFLERGLQAVILLGVIIIVAGLFAGRSRLATKWRGVTSNTLHEFGSFVPESVRRWIRGYTPVLRWASVIAMLLCLGAHSPIDVAAVVWTSIITLLLFVIIEVLSGPDRVDGVEAVEVIIVEEIEI